MVSFVCYFLIISSLILDDSFDVILFKNLLLRNQIIDDWVNHAPSCKYLSDLHGWF